MVELHLTSLNLHGGSVTASTENLLQWLHLLKMPWAIGKTAKTVQKRMTSVMKEFNRLQKNHNARANRGGNEKATSALRVFLDAPFDKLTGR